MVAQTAGYRRRAICWALTLLATAALCLATRSWRDPYHCVYDVATGVVFFSFVAQIVTDAFERRIDARWWSRALLLVPIGVVCVGVFSLQWEISGHLTALLIVAGAQSLNRRLPVLTRVAYWAPVPMAVWLRWSFFDRGVHTETYSAAVVATLSVGALVVWQRLAERCRPSTITPPR